MRIIFPGRMDFIRLIMNVSQSFWISYPITYGKSADIYRLAEVGALRCSGSLEFKDDMVTVLNGLESTMPVNFTIEREYISVIVKP
ncbi:MAG: hypothetical protein ACLVEJ_07870 [Parabacteroides sp.]